MMGLVKAQAEEFLPSISERFFRCAFADPPDNIGLPYNSFDDHQDDANYVNWLTAVIYELSRVCDVSWISYNARWTFLVGKIVAELLTRNPRLQAKPFCQVFEFGQHNHNDCGNNHRPLVRLKWDDVTLYPDAIRVPSWRQLHGDKRADPRGRVPGDIFNFPRVTGNSRQRRRWHPTQLHEGLIERCLKMSCIKGDKVLDLFSGTGTTMRVCRRLELDCLSVECDLLYCELIAEENELVQIDENNWRC